MEVTALLGIAGNFFKKYWKFIAIAIVIALLYMWHRGAVIEYGNERFQAGVDTTLVKVKEQVTELNKKHRKTEEGLQKQIDNFAEKQGKADKKRRDKEDKITQRVDVMLQSVPMWNSEECAITPAILSERNAIRELGPS